MARGRATTANMAPQLLQLYRIDFGPGAVAAASADKVAPYSCCSLRFIPPAVPALPAQGAPRPQW